MHSTTLFSATLATTLIASVRAHGQLTGIVADGKYYQGYTPSLQYTNPPPSVIGWSIPSNSDNGPVYPAAYSSPDIICGPGATPGQASATVSAGSTIDLQWTVWPDSHHGPVLDYLAPCNGDCTTAKKESLKWTKIDAEGMVKDSSTPGQPGYWAADQLKANNNTWNLQIPKEICPGNYVLRHEIIALHAADHPDGAQNYPKCVNLKITGGGNNCLTEGGTLGTKLYGEADPGIQIGIYSPLQKGYMIPGPQKIGGAGGSGGGAGIPKGGDTPGDNKGATQSQSQYQAAQSQSPITTSGAPPFSTMRYYGNSTATVTSSATPAPVQNFPQGQGVQGAQPTTMATSTKKKCKIPRPSSSSNAAAQQSYGAVVPPGTSVVSLASEMAATETPGAGGYGNGGGSSGSGSSSGSSSGSGSESGSTHPSTPSTGTNTNTNNGDSSPSSSSSSSCSNCPCLSTPAGKQSFVESLSTKDLLSLLGMITKALAGKMAGGGGSAKRR